MSEAVGSLFVISAPSGAGKTSLAQAAINRLRERGQSLEFSVSYTTRKPRPGEQDAVHYHFVNAAKFQRMVDEGAMLEHATVFGNSYGTGRQVTERALAAGTDLVLDIDWQGARQLAGNMGAAVCSIFVMPPSVAELERRLRARAQDSDEVIAARMAEAGAEMSHYPEYQYLLVNDDFERAVDDLMSIMAARRMRVDVQATHHQQRLSELLALKGETR